MSDVDTGAAAAVSDTTAIADVQTVDTTPEAKTNDWQSVEKTIDDTFTKLHPPREATGQFKGKDTPAAGAEPSDTAPKITDQNPAEVATEPPKVAAIDAPLSWSAEMKSKFATLPPDAQSYIAQREGEAHKRISELGQQVKAVEPIRNVVEHFRDTFTRNGLEPADGIARMLNVETMLERDPEGTIREIAKAYGVDLSGSQPNTQEPGQESGEIRALKAEIAQMKRSFGETASKVTARERAEQAETQAALDKLVEDFSKDKTDLAEIEGDFVAQISAIMQLEPGLAKDKILAKAYESARWGNPNTRAKLLAEQDKQKAATADAERAKKAAEAKKAGSLNVKSTSASPAKKGSWEQTVDEVAARAAAR